MRNPIFMLLAMAIAVSASGGPATGDAKEIQGTWVPVTAEIGGQSMSKEFFTSTVLKLSEGKYEVTVAGAFDKGAFTLGAGAKPKTIDITGTQGPNAGKKIPCIYELQGDTLKICYGLGVSARPTEFKSSPGTQHFLVTYERKKL